MSVRDTIYALSSGAGRAGVAVIRISGPATCQLVIQMCGGRLKPRKASLRSITHPQTGDILDQALVLWFPAPNSFTGEDLAEIHLHGGPAVIAAVLEAIGLSDDVRMAQAGEFTRRAFYNDKLDLTGIEAIADLIEAETEAQRKQALRQMHGGLSELLQHWRERLIHILAYVEAGIDFGDEEDVGADVNRLLKCNILDLKSEILRHLDDQRAGERVRNGLQVVIAGPPNAGKSSLLNVLAKRDVAIVSEQAGTTRDIIDVHLDLKGFPVTVSDTAGLRGSEDLIEGEGIRRARGRVKDADIILWTTDGEIAEEGHDFTVDSDQFLIRIRNKHDSDLFIPEMDTKISDTGCHDMVAISTKTGAGIAELIQKIGTIAEGFKTLGEDVVITRARHREALMHVVEILSVILEEGEQAEELIAENLRVCSRELGRITGKVDVEDLLDVIFNDFCIGK